MRRVKSSYLTYADTVSRFIDALRLSGVEEAKVKDYAQFSYRVLEFSDDVVVDDDDNSKENNKPIKEWSREDVDKVATKIISKRRIELLNHSYSIKNSNA